MNPPSGEPLPQFHAPDGRLSNAAVQSWEQQGVLLLEAFFSLSQCRTLRQRAEHLLEAWKPEDEQVRFADVGNSAAADAHLAASAEAISVFLEQDATDAEGRLRCDRHQAVNKIGHALHDLDPVFNAFSRDPAMARLSRSLGMRKPLLVQSMYIFKQPRIGGEVSLHQDSTFLYSRPQSCIGLWVALEDATLRNGCLYAAPGGHRGPLRKRFRAPGAGAAGSPPSAHMQVLDETPWPDRQVALPVTAGSLIVLHGRLPHGSGPNLSEQSRHAYSLHLMEADADWPADNWLQRSPALPLRGFSDGGPTAGS